MAAPHFDENAGDEPGARPELGVPGDLAARKQAVRQQAARRRAGADPARGILLARHVLAERPPPRGAAISGFWPMGDEIDIRPLLTALHARGHDVLLPVTPRRGQPLAFRHWNPGDAMVNERFGTQCPRPDAPPGVPDVLFVPLLAFDRAGRRLGYGGGFYDRTLALLPDAVAIGCAYAIQEVDEVPADEYDRRLAAIATDQGVIGCDLS